MENEAIEADVWMFVDNWRAALDIAQGNFTKRAKKVRGGYLVPMRFTNQPLNFALGAINYIGRIL